MESDTMEGRVVFADGTSQPLVYNRHGRMVERFEMDGDVYVRPDRYIADIRALHEHRRELESRNAELAQLVRDMRRGHECGAGCAMYDECQHPRDDRCLMEERMAALGIEVD